MSKRISPLECSLTKNGSVSPLPSTLPKLLDLNAPGITLLQKRVGGGRLWSYQLRPGGNLEWGHHIVLRFWHPQKP